MSDTKRRVGDLSSAERKEAPLFSGTMSYFPDALCAVAVLCKRANDKHNPGEPLHWSKGKSADHADCLARHLLDRGKPDEFGLDHRIAVAWRALSDLQTAIEESGWDSVVGATLAEPIPVSPEEDEEYGFGRRGSCPAEADSAPISAVADQPTFEDHHNVGNPGTETPYGHPSRPWPQRARIRLVNRREMGLDSEYARARVREDELEAELFGKRYYLQYSKATGQRGFSVDPRWIKAGYAEIIEDLS